MSFINWGDESPEQRAIRARLEQDAIYEQAARIRRVQASQTGGVGGGQLNVAIDPSENLYVENGYIDDYFE